MRETVEIMRYPVTLTPAPEGGYMVSFVDIPEALTQGETVAEAMEAAKDALLTAFDFYFEDNELIPLPSPLNSHDHFIEVPLSVASKVLLLNAFLQSEITQQEGNDSNLLIVFYVQIMPDDFVMQLPRF